MAEMPAMAQTPATVAPMLSDCGSTGFAPAETEALVASVRPERGACGATNACTAQSVAMRAATTERRLLRRARAIAVALTLRDEDGSCDANLA
mmetsp:Transcript_67236/g.82390  ORF Transcript_67236/g.82390 Transcript_67236/m.82390 type:complete len:93 (-) Transcript_67236:12-290(-)